MGGDLGHYLEVHASDKQVLNPVAISGPQ